MTEYFDKINKQQEYIRWEQKRRGIMTEKELKDHLATGVLDLAEFKQLVHEEIISFLRADEIMGDIFDTNDKEFLSDEEIIGSITGMKAEIEYLKRELDRYREYLRESRADLDRLLIWEEE